MPEGATARATELIQLLEDQRGPGDRVAVVRFGSNPALERALSEDARFSGFARTVSADGSNLAAALDRPESHGQVYNIGGDSERMNIDVVKGILAALGKPESLIHYVKDRPGHDRRYAIDFRKAEEHLSFKPSTTFEQGLETTVAWYADNEAWWRPLKDASFQEYYAKHYGKLGLKT